MLIKTDQGFEHPTPSDITPRAVFEQRRGLLKTLAAGAAGPSLALWAARDARAQAATTAGPGRLPKLAAQRSTVEGAVVMEKLTAYEHVTGYNNFYEFGLEKNDPARLAHTLRTRPWTVTVEGECAKPRTFGIEDLLKLAPMEERIYRLRCVEGWSMVVPWVGYSVSNILRAVEPTGKAKFVEFITLADRTQMPGLRSSVLDWPYKEGLRLDEAMHPLTLMAFGLYGEVLPNQNGAPLRLVVPWKYGFKSAKSIVKIRLLERQPRSSWEESAASEYGFYSNVNPQVDHPRWSQATERRIGEDGVFQRKRPTLMFNGYEAQVGQLYAGMDLRKFY
ncbi:MAG: protein-methionine-sulfoxide reductase catalytic subunit MsrP [Burkholderiales bacterium]|nr:protein-methionine-sulfoxide reductase catalytic subunit MsrP [Burkholderiales bacterium]